MTPVICTVDVVLLTLDKGALSVALFKRDKEPFAGRHALPGGFIHAQDDKTAFDAALRVLKDKTGVTSPYLEQLATYSGADRDPRGWSVSIVYFALVPKAVLDIAGTADMRIENVDALRSLPFDHLDIVRTAVSRVRSKSVYSSLPVYLLPKEFTLGELQETYETVMGEPVNKVTFRRKMDELAMLEPTGELDRSRPNRPAQLFRLKKEFRHTLSTVERPLNS